MGVGIGTASTTPKPICDGTSHGRSQAKLLGKLQEAGWLPAGSPLVGLPPKVWTGDALELARLLRFDRGLKRGIATMRVRAAFKTAVEKEQSRGRGASAPTKPGQRKRCASSRGGEKSCERVST